MALTADKILTYKEGLEIPIPVGASKEIFAGSMVCLDGTTRYAEAGTDAANKIFAGIAREYVKEITAVAGAISVLLRRKGLFLLKYEPADAEEHDVGKAVFLADDGNVNLTAGVDNQIYVGIIAGIESLTEVWVDIHPALLQSDVAVHIADGTAAHAASAISITDASDHFPAATDTVEEAIDTLTKTFIMNFAIQTIATAATDVAIAEDFEAPIPIRIKRAYATLVTAPGSGKTLTIEINGTTTLCTVAGTAKKGELENLDIAVAANTDFDITLTQDTGAADGLNLMLVCEVDDGV